MSKSPHLVVSISGHGFGHVAQTAPILNLLHEHMPLLQLTVRSSVPLSHLRTRIQAPFAHLQSTGDIGMVMSSALDIRIEESRATYRAFHADWDKTVSDEAGLLRELEATAVFSNVGYLPLAGAQLAGIPNVALCSLNWADIYRHSCGDDFIATQIRTCYSNGDAFLRATPGMAMSDLNNRVPVAPIASIGQNRRDEINRCLQLSVDEKLVLVSMGGIDSRLPVYHWPRIDGVRWLVQSSWQVNHPDAIFLESLPMSFSDVLASCDVLLCKPGYGRFAEAACSGTPVLYVDRPNWPETPALVEWLHQNAVCREISREQLEAGDFAADLAAIWLSPKPPRVEPVGTEQVVQWLMSHFFAREY